MKAVLDPNVIISAALSPRGAPAQVLRLWIDGGYELVCSRRLLDELERALAYPKLRKHIDSDDAAELVDFLERGALLIDDPSDPAPVSSPDPDDDYLIALADGSRSILVSGDHDLLRLADQIPVYSPTQFLALFVD